MIVTIMNPLNPTRQEYNEWKYMGYSIFPPMAARLDPVLQSLRQMALEGLCMRRTFLLLILVLAPLLSFSACGGGGTGTDAAPASPPAGGGRETGIPGIDGIRQEFLDAVNGARATARFCGATHFDTAPPVAWSDNLAMAAYLHSFDMATNKFFSHTGSDGSSPGVRISREGYDWASYGENIAVGYPTVSAVIQAWLGSEGHCRNIMNPAFEEIGAGFAEGPYSGSPTSRYWTFDLASPR